MKRKKMVYLDSELLLEFGVYAIVKDVTFSDMLSVAMREYLKAEKRDDKIWERAKQNIK